MSFGKLGARFGRLGASSKTGAASSWWDPNSSVDVDPENNRAWVSGTGPVALSTLLSVSRAASQTITDASGNVSSVGSNVLAVSNAGLQIYPAATNTVLHSQAFTDAVWAVFRVTQADNTTLAPDGTTTAATLTATGVNGSHVIQQAVTLTPGTTYTASCYFKQGTAQFVQCCDSGGTADQFCITMDTATGQMVYQGGLALVIGEVTPAANGFFRLCVTFRVGSTNSPTVIVWGMVPSINSTKNAASTLSGTVFAWGAQLEVNNRATPYIPTTTASVTRPADVVSITGALATALTGTVGTISMNVKSTLTGSADTPTFIAANNLILLGKDKYDSATTNVAGALFSGTAANWRSGANLVNLAWDASGGAMQVNGGAIGTDAVARHPATSLFLGSKSGASYLTGVMGRITVYPTKNTLSVTATGPQLRSWSKLVSPFAGNPVIPYNANSTNTLGADTPYIKNTNVIAGTYYTVTQGNNGSGGAAWNNLNMYTTTDFQTYTPYASNPVLTNSPGSADDHFLQHPTIIKIGSLFYMYYQAKSSGGANTICAATSTDFINWTKLGTVIADNVVLPSVILNGSTYYMYVGTPSGKAILYYTSPDGLTWTLGTTNSGNALTIAATDMIAGTTGLSDISVVQNPANNYYELVFTGNTNAANSPYTTQQLWWAISSDGINFTKLQAPILQGDGQVGSVNQQYPGDGMMFFNGSSVWLLFAGVGPAAQGCLYKLVP